MHLTASYIRFFRPVYKLSARNFFCIRWIMLAVFLVFSFKTGDAQYHNQNFQIHTYVQVQQTTPPDKPHVLVPDQASLKSVMKIALRNEVLGALQTGVAFLAAVFFIIAVIDFFRRTMLDKEPVQTNDILKFVGVLSLLIFYKDIVYGLIDPTMTNVCSIIEKAATNGASAKTLESYLDTSFSWGKLMDSPGLTIFEGAAAYLIKLLDQLVTSLFQMYANVSIFFTLVIGYIIIAFALFPTLYSFVGTWLKILAKYYVYLIVISMGISASYAAQNVFLQAAGPGTLVTGIWISIAMSCLAFKIIFILVGFKVIDSVFGGGGGGLGSVVGGMVGGMAAVAGNGMTMMKGK